MKYHQQLISVGWASGGLRGGRGRHGGFGKSSMKSYQTNALTKRPNTRVIGGADSLRRDTVKGLLRHLDAHVARHWTGKSTAKENLNHLGVHTVPVWRLTGLHFYSELNKSPQRRRDSQRLSIYIYRWIFKNDRT